MRRIQLHLVPVGVLLAACGSGGATGGPPTAVTYHPVAATYVVADYLFPALTVAPGVTVTVTDGDTEPHTVTAEDGSFDTGSFDGTDPGTFTAPTQPGSYPVICKVHPSMHGTIVVQAP